MALVLAEIQTILTLARSLGAGPKGGNGWTPYVYLPLADRACVVVVVVVVAIICCCRRRVVESSRGWRCASCGRCRGVDVSACLSDVYEVANVSERACVCLSVTTTTTTTTVNTTTTTTNAGTFPAARASSKKARSPITPSSSTTSARWTSVRAASTALFCRCPSSS